MQAGRAEEPTADEGLRATPRRLVIHADADRRAIERQLHDGLQQHLVALAVTVQLAAQAADSDPAGARALLDELTRDVQVAVEEAALLAQRIYPTDLAAGGLAVLLRSAASNAGRKASVDVVARTDLPAEIAMTVYLCWLDALGPASDESRATIRVRESDDALDFDVVAGAADRGDGLAWLQNRVEALGGRLAITRRGSGGVSVSGSLPFER